MQKTKVLANSGSIGTTVELLPVGTLVEISVEDYADQTRKLLNNVTQRRTKAGRRGILS